MLCHCFIIFIVYFLCVCVFILFSFVLFVCLMIPMPKSSKTNADIDLYIVCDLIIFFVYSIATLCCSHLQCCFIRNKFAALQRFFSCSAAFAVALSLALAVRFAVCLSSLFVWRTRFVIRKIAEHPTSIAGMGYTVTPGPVLQQSCWLRVETPIAKKSACANAVSCCHNPYLSQA